jgi:flotillin
LQRIAVAAAEAEAVAGEATSRRDLEIARKEAEQEQRVRVAVAEASAVTGENESRARIAESNAQLGEIAAEAERRAEVAEAKAQEAILIAEREQELARLAKEKLAPQEIEKKRIEIAAEAEAEKKRREAAGEADAIRLRYQAEADGTLAVLEAKAEGYRRMVLACAENPQLAPTLLLIEQLPALVAEQVKAVQNLKIDKITVWDTGAGENGRSATTDFLSGLIGALPRLHELADQAGIELPPALGRIGRMTGTDRMPIVGGGEDREGRFAKETNGDTLPRTNGPAAAGPAGPVA